MIETRGEVRQASFGTKLGAFLASGLSVYLLLSLVYLGMGSYHEMRYWDSLNGAAPFPAQGQLAKDAEELERAPVPISESKRLLARSGREGFASIRPNSAPRAPLSGWVHHPDFKLAVQGVEEWRKAHQTPKDSSSPARGQEIQ